MLELEDDHSELKQEILENTMQTDWNYVMTESWVRGFMK